MMQASCLPEPSALQPGESHVQLEDTMRMRSFLPIFACIALSLAAHEARSQECAENYWQEYDTIHHGYGPGDSTVYQIPVVGIDPPLYSGYVKCMNYPTGEGLTKLKLEVSTDIDVTIKVFNMLY